jgi:excisionase family DNA binding protein
MLRQPAQVGSLTEVTAVADAEPDLRPVREAASYLSVTPRSVYNWIKDGRLTEYKTPTGRRRIDFNELRRLVRE